ncbi:MAG: hypothetical protein ACR652_24350 [Methylocystis sp.]|uniref:hypothetical protein n=1 Tax=Methylocystis sp. TaxID=1911079 RepID=UPI003DA42CC5
MASFTCKYCGAVKDEGEFYKQSRQRCKKCHNARNRECYNRLYRTKLRAARRERDFARKNVPLVISQIDLAYAAGLLDGEGCIRITKRGRMGGVGLRVGQCTLTVEVTNTDEGMLRWLRDKFAGSVAFTPENREHNRRAVWHWHCTSNKALRLLDAVYPFLRTKRRQAKLARRFQRYVQVTGRAMTPRIQALQDRFHSEIATLNKRGVR